MCQIEGFSFLFLAAVTEENRHFKNGKQILFIKVIKNNL